MTSKWQALQTRLAELHDLNMAHWILQWDQNTYMPPGGAEARASQMATLQKIRHERLTSEETARLIEEASQEIEGASFDSLEASLVRVARDDYQYASGLPTEFVERYANATATAFDVWRKAKAAKDYSIFLPALRRVTDLKMEEAQIRGYGDGHPYDVFLDVWERGISTAEVRRIFDAQRQGLIDLLDQVESVQDRVDDSVLHQPFDIDAQRKLSKLVSTKFGFDYENWATFDEAPHPFCLQIAREDIRLTTRFRPDFLNPAFYGTLHETGHGLHGHGFAPEIDGTFLSDMESYSHAVCESQSRTWENLVGRSRAFWEWLYPQALEIFPEQFGSSSPEQLYKAANKARNQFLRVEADELTYNLHIMLRFDLEVAIVEGQLKLEDAPEAWNDTFQQYFGITPADDAEGIMQDVHWSVGGMGAFNGYALGNLLAVQYYNEALKAHPDMPDRIAKGDFETLLGWLTENIYQHGRKFNAEQLTERITGTSIDAQPFVEYLKAKYTDVYGL